MAEYISREDVLANIYATHSCGGFKRECDYLWLHNQVINATTADLQPVRRGRWELIDNPNFRKCSECGAWWSSDITDNYFTNYCPKCGARMIKDGDTNG